MRCGEMRSVGRCIHHHIGIIGSGKQHNVHAAPTLRQIVAMECDVISAVIDDSNAIEHATGRGDRDRSGVIVTESDVDRWPSSRHGPRKTILLFILLRSLASRSRCGNRASL
jgi:hypothetical protein